jgi:hypothetical protein
MRNEGPTVPTPNNAASTAPAADAARSEMPTWPVEAERRRRLRDARPASGERPRAVLLGLSLVANIVLLASLLGVLTLTQAGFFVQGAASGQSPTGQTLSSTLALASPSPSPSPTPNVSSLQVTPVSVRLTCTSDQRSQVVTLQNTGSSTAQWRATFSSQMPGVSVSPQQGELAAGESASIQVQNTTRSTGPQGSSGRQGVITFASSSADSGQAAQLTYATVGCH